MELTHADGSLVEIVKDNYTPFSGELTVRVWRKASDFASQPKDACERKKCYDQYDIEGLSVNFNAAGSNGVSIGNAMLKESYAALNKVKGRPHRHPDFTVYDNPS